jgi:hypothetical protein
LKTTLGTAVAGLLLGAVAIPLVRGAFAPLGFVVFAALVGLGALRSESRALAGGVLVAFGLWWVHFIRQAVERCEVLDRQPNGSCSIYGTEEQLVLAGTVALVGVVLVAVELGSQRASS